MTEEKEDMKWNIDDKDLVIVSVTTIAIISLFVLADPTTILTSILSGLFGLATGRRMDNSSTVSSSGK